MDLSIEQIEQGLETEIESMTNEVTTDEKNLSLKRRKLKQLIAARTALMGDSPKPDSMKKEILIKLFRQILEDNGPLDLRDLDGLAQAKAKEIGQSLIAYGPCKKAALRSGKFEIDEDGRVSLKESAARVSQAG